MLENAENVWILALRFSASALATVFPTVPGSSQFITTSLSPKIVLWGDISLLVPSVWSLNVNFEYFTTNQHAEKGYIYIQMKTEVMKFKNYCNTG